MKTEAWEQLKAIILSDAEADSAHIALESGDLAELGRIIEAHIYKAINIRYELTQHATTLLKDGKL